MKRLQLWSCLEQGRPINKSEEKFSRSSHFPRQHKHLFIPITHAEWTNRNYRDCVASRQSAKVIRLEIIRYHNIS